jgi:putative pyruvate formate lyase activating enzyme
VPYIILIPALPPTVGFGPVPLLPQLVNTDFADKYFKKSLPWCIINSLYCGGDFLYLEFNECTLCPRNCKVDRNVGSMGFCKATNEAEICRIGLHHLEEPIISGKNGSGTIFFAHCNLGCLYCQNFEISKGVKKGKIYSADALANEMLKLQKNGAHNINLVTPTHYMPIIKTAILTARKAGLNIPTVYNTSGFEKPEEIEKLKGVVDIFLTDLKYYSPYYSKRYSATEDYFDFAFEAIKQMIKNVGSVTLDSNGMMNKGVIIRHLMLPDLISDTQQILKLIATHFGDKVIVSLMRQYTPICKSLPDSLGREITDEEYQVAFDLFHELGLEGYAQGKKSVGADKIPKWDL